MTYSIVTPAYNEERFIAGTLESVVAQTVRPAEWVIVDDGSTDLTRDVVDGFAGLHPWIRLVDSGSNDLTEYGARVASVVNRGMAALLHDVDVVVKLDADVSFEVDFCERILAEFRRDDTLGIASGRLIQNGRQETLRFGDNTRGATKFYRRRCLQQIGGLYVSRGWDVMDDVAARLHGWTTRTLDLPFHHHKPEGRRSGILKKHYYTGLFNGRVPYHPLYFALKLAKAAVESPPILGAASQGLGYFVGRVQPNRPFPSDVCAHMRREQVKRMKQLGGMMRAGR